MPFSRKTTLFELCIYGKDVSPARIHRRGGSVSVIFLQFY